MSVKANNEPTAGGKQALMEPRNRDRPKSAWQFGLRRTFVIVTVFAALFAGLRNFGAYGEWAAAAVGTYVAIVLVARMQFYLAFPLGILLWTAIAIGIEAADRSWGALGMALVVGPSVNGAAALFAALYIVVRHVREPSYGWGTDMAAAIASPILSTAAIFVALDFIDGHGC